MSSQKKQRCNLLIVDNFYNNPIETRNYVLTQEFKVRGNYPGQRTISYANEQLKQSIQKYIEPFAGKIIQFPIPKEDGSDSDKISNGAFQYTTSRDRSWVHTDHFNDWGAVVFLTPDAPVTGGTAFFKFKDGSECEEDVRNIQGTKPTDQFSQDMTKWTKVDEVGNVFNRVVIFDSNRFHMSIDYIGMDQYDGRLFQVFFFSTEK